jgi:hypothetical protein
MSNGTVEYGGRAVERKGGRPVATPARLAATSLALAFFTALPLFRPAALSAHVGYEPDRSPFHDINTAQSLGLTIGRFSGSRGYAGVGAQPATAIGLRFRNRLSGPLELAINGTWVASQRLFIDPTRPDSTRNRGNVDFGMLFADIGLHLSLTGAKRWHGLAPWLGFGFGIMSSANAASDPGGYKASSGFTVVPAVGTSVFFSDKLSLEFEFRDNTIRYEYPLAYFNPTDPSTGAALPPPIIPITRLNKQLTHNFTLSLGASYHFSF